MRYGSLVRLIRYDPDLVEFKNPVDPEDVVSDNMYGCIEIADVSRGSGSLRWHVVSFPDLGSYARVRSDILEIVG
jgi:hypothetical protein